MHTTYPIDVKVRCMDIPSPRIIELENCSYHIFIKDTEHFKIVHTVGGN